MKTANLRVLREARFWSQADLAQHSGVSRQTICRLEAGLADARFKTVRLLASALRVEPGQLLIETQGACS